MGWYASKICSIIFLHMLIKIQGNKMVIERQNTIRVIEIVKKNSVVAFISRLQASVYIDCGANQ